MNNLFEKLLILRTTGIGPVKYGELIQKFGDAARAAASLRADTALRDSVLREMDMAATLGIKYLCDDDPLYPTALRDIKNHPPVLTVRGNLSVLSKPAVAMVGTRHATAAGMKLMSDMAEKFAHNGYAVVSGMAMGTDTAAHRGALRANTDSSTIAVLAGGVDNIWPLENERLYHEIISRGAVISEMPVGMAPIASNFIQRNRWIAGIAEKLILGEADLKSGSMSTARFAIEYGRPVFAIPSHPLDSRSIGPNELIQKGHAKLCTGADDFFGNAQKANLKQKKSEKNDTENSILDMLGIIPVSESVLAELVKKNIADIKTDLVVLELQGKVRKTDGGYIKV